MYMRVNNINNSNNKTDKKFIDNEKNDNHNDNGKSLFISFILILMVALWNIYP